MNQFKVGDTVWTIKKGIGKIIAGYMDETNRPFCVQWPSGLWSFPKLSNLYRIEAEMIEAKKCNTGHGWFSTVGFWPDLPDPPQPKFKRGDKVYYEGKKWEVLGIAYSVIYELIRNENGFPTWTTANINKLRLWKEHEFTHMAAGNEPKGMDIRQITDLDKRNINPSAYKSVTYLGVSASKMDTFHCVTNEGTSVIIYGKKGDIEI